MDYKVLDQELIDYLTNLDKIFKDQDIQPVTSGRKESFELYSSDKRCFFHWIWIEWAV